MKNLLFIFFIFVLHGAALAVQRKNCSELFMKSYRVAPASYEMKDGFIARPANESDVSVATEVIHRAFDVWKRAGLSLSPMFQDDSKTRAHLVEKGFVIESPSQEIIGTFSVEDSRLENDGPFVQFFEGSDIPYPYKKLTAEIIPSGRFLVFRKAAVLPKFRQSGLGMQMLDIAELIAKREGYQGLILETVESADWLFNWYLKLGFSVIGRYQYPNSAIETVLMIRPFAENFK